jgi:hypothetical protein
MTKLAFSEIDLSFMEAWYADGYSLGSIAQGYGCGLETVRRRLRNRNVVMRGAHYVRPRFTADENGYVRLRGNRYEHRVVAARMLGRPLRRGEVVHHKNCNRADNRPENLEILDSHSRHARLHAKQQQQSRDPETGRFKPGHSSDFPF